MPETPTDHPPRIPNIPDLRFENSYLKSISPFVKIQRNNISNTQLHPKEVDYEIVESTASRQNLTLGQSREDVIINWSKVFWITTRDQVLSPFIQGAVWGIAGHFLVPFMQRLRSRSTRYLKTRLAVGEGRGAAWLRDWVRSFGLGKRTRA